MANQAETSRRSLTASSENPTPQLGFAESGARRANGEFKRWVHLRVEFPPIIPSIATRLRRGNYNDMGDTIPFTTVVYPWPFASLDLQEDILIAHWHIHRFRYWNEPWPNFAGFVRFHKVRAMSWLLAPNVLPKSQDSGFRDLTKEFMDALK